MAIAYLGRHQAHTNFPVEEYAAEWRELEELRVDDAIALVKRRARSAKLLARQRREGSAAGPGGRPAWRQEPSQTLPPKTCFKTSCFKICGRSRILQNHLYRCA